MKQFSLEKYLENPNHKKIIKSTNNNGKQNQTN